MTKYKVTLIIESDEDPSALLDEFTDHESDMYHLDPDADDFGVAVTIEEIDED